MAEFVCWVNLIKYQYVEDIPHPIKKKAALQIKQRGFLSFPLQKKVP
jgi:hypothetical protein